MTQRTSSGRLQLITTWIEPETLEALARLAQHLSRKKGRKITRSLLIREACREYLKRNGGELSG